MMIAGSPGAEPGGDLLLQYIMGQRKPPRSFQRKREMRNKFRSPPWPCNGSLQAFYVRVKRAR